MLYFNLQFWNEDEETLLMACGSVFCL